MAWPWGTRLGPYEVLTRIGTGGMGEVYAARDVNLCSDAIAWPARPPQTLE
jgi:serine/threonine protein kinase